MKHTLPVTLALVLLFVVTQVLGLWMLSHSMDVSVEDGVVAASYEDTLLGERPEASASGAVLMLLLGICIGTLVLLLLVKFKKRGVWKAWFFLAVLVTVSVSVASLLPLPAVFAWVIGAGLALWKIRWPNVIVHNLTEVLTYTGIALIFAPLLQGSILWGIILLTIISAYDAYAVWKSKHMVRMAEFQAESKVFAGLFVPYGGKMPKSTMKVSSKTSSDRPRHAILGGGDLAFPLLFGGVVMEHFVLSGFSVPDALVRSLFVAVGATVAIGALFTASKKDRFYPAMPFISAGCLLGYAASLLI